MHALDEQREIIGELFGLPLAGHDHQRRSFGFPNKPCDRKCLGAGSDDPSSRHLGNVLSSPELDERLQRGIHPGVIVGGQGLTDSSRTQRRSSLA